MLRDYNLPIILSILVLLDILITYPLLKSGSFQEIGNPLGYTPISFLMSGMGLLVIFLSNNFMMVNLTRYWKGLLFFGIIVRMSAIIWNFGNLVFFYY